MIIRGGENIYPREIEEFLYQLKDQRRSGGGIPSENTAKKSERSLFCTKVSAWTKSMSEFCRGKIARHKIPKYVFFVDSFPMTGSGKIQKFKLKDLGLKLLEKRGD